MENSIKPDKDSKRKLSAPEEEQRNSEYGSSVYVAHDDFCDFGGSGESELLATEHSSKEFDKN